MRAPRSGPSRRHRLHCAQQSRQDSAPPADAKVVTTHWPVRSSAAGKLSAGVRWALHALRRMSPSCGCREISINRAARDATKRRLQLRACTNLIWVIPRRESPLDRLRRVVRVGPATGTRQIGPRTTTSTTTASVIAGSCRHRSRMPESIVTVFPAVSLEAKGPRCKARSSNGRRVRVTLYADARFWPERLGTLVRVRGSANGMP
jgi:hypothetical protein